MRSQLVRVNAASVGVCRTSTNLALKRFALNFSASREWRAKVAARQFLNDVSGSIGTIVSRDFFS